MRIQNLKLPAEPAANASPSALQPAPSAGVTIAAEPPGDRHALEVALLRARIQHLELVIETARSLMGSNQERLLRRLHEVPRDIAGLTVQLRQIDPNVSW